MSKKINSGNFKGDNKYRKFVNNAKISPGKAQKDMKNRIKNEEHINHIRT